MKTFLKSFLLVLVVSLMSCGGKKEDRAAGPAGGAQIRGESPRRGLV